LGKYSVFKALAAGISRKYFVLRYLEPKKLKTENLCGALREAKGERDAAAGLRTRNNSQLQNSGLRETIRKGCAVATS
jgi:hypothetical protein